MTPDPFTDARLTELGYRITPLDFFAPEKVLYTLTYPDGRVAQSYIPGNLLACARADARRGLIGVG